MPALRRLAFCGLLAAAFAAPFALNASVAPQKHQDRLPAYGAGPATDSAALAAFEPGLNGRGDRLAPGAIAHCDPRPWLNDAPTCLRPATADEPARLVRVVTIEQRVGPATSALVRTTLEQVAAR
ncbi:hypothetical protein [Salinarimonas sp.]|uniref:hypothetical protein n=1 Tax=Salinarimonas sp. TaxID=2766526 RepID=UPI0032D8BAFA